MESNPGVSIDLHIHSTASDGTFSPSEIIARAVQLSLGAVAITDHDTVSGAREAISAGIPDGLGFLSGVEITSTPPLPFHCSGSFHILGYAVDTEDVELGRLLARLRAARRDRNPKIIERLNALGIHITLDEVVKASGDAQISRPHIASLMVERALVPTIDEAFDRYLDSGAPAFVEKFQIDPESAMRIIIGAGGIPVLAHPVYLGDIRENSRKSDLEALIVHLKGIGLMGIEVYYPDHPREITEQLSRLARRHDLLETGGSDFHGAIKEEISMGTGKGELSVPYELYTRLKNAADSLKSTRA